MYNNDDTDGSDSESKMTKVDKQRVCGRRGKKQNTNTEWGMDVLNTVRAETECGHAVPVEVKLFPISIRVWKFNFTAGETISNKHGKEVEEELRRKRAGRGQAVNPHSHGLSQTSGWGWAGLRAEGVEKWYH